MTRIWILRHRIKIRVSDDQVSEQFLNYLSESKMELDSVDVHVKLLRDLRHAHKRRGMFQRWSIKSRTSRNQISESIAATRLLVKAQFKISLGGIVPLLKPELQLVAQHGQL